MKYNDIIHMSRPISKRKKMSLSQRAAQFSPFAALTGHDAAIKETARLTNERVELDEQEIKILNEKLFYLKEHLPYSIKVTYFIPDELKDGGMYHTIENTLLKIDEVNNLLIFDNHLRLSIYDIIKIDFDSF